MIMCHMSRWPRQGLKEGLGATAKQEQSPEVPACAKALKQQSVCSRSGKNGSAAEAQEQGKNGANGAKGQGGRTMQALAATLTVLIPRKVESC